MSSKSIFERIIAREIPAEIVWENDRALAFKDVNPQAPVHVLVIPKICYQRLDAVPVSEGELLGELLLHCAEVARQMGIDQTGYRVVINNGPHGGESVPHLHIHLLGGRPLSWPPG